MSEIYVTLWGNVATEPRQMKTEGGVSLTKFRLACTASRRDPTTGAFSDGPTSWYTVTCWRELAVNVAASLLKGQPVVVHGRQRVRDWEADDRHGTEVAIDASSVGHDLRWGQASFDRIKRGQRPGEDASRGESDEDARPAALASVESLGEPTDPWAEDSGRGAA